MPDESPKARVDRVRRNIAYALEALSGQRPDMTDWPAERDEALALFDEMTEAYKCLVFMRGEPYDPAELEPADTPRGKAQRAALKHMKGISEA